MVFVKKWCKIHFISAPIDNYSGVRAVDEASNEMCGYSKYHVICNVCLSSQANAWRNRKSSLEGDCAIATLTHRRSAELLLFTQANKARMISISSISIDLMVWWTIPINGNQIENKIVQLQPNKKNKLN